MGAMIVKPSPRACQELEASAGWWCVVDALGITPEQICAEDLRPRKFVAKGFWANRVADATYYAWISRTLPDDDLSESWGSSRTILADPGSEHSEQQAGARLLELANLWTGRDGRALRRWLELWGWTPPPRNNPSAAPLPPMVI